jgi:hypothetical protein
MAAPAYDPTAFTTLEAIMVDKDRIRGLAEQAKGKRRMLLER